jgi:hypothetical protein
VVSRGRRVVLTVAGALALALAITNMVLVETNRTLQLEVNARSQFIQQTIPLEGLNRDIVGAIAQLSVRNKDDALGSVLSQHGITVTASAMPPARGTTVAPSAARR